MVSVIFTRVRRSSAGSAKITELYLMIRRPLRPSFPQSFEQDYLDALERARSFTIRFGSAQTFQSDARLRSDALKNAIDGMAEVLTGDRQHFGLKPPSYPSS